MPTPNPATRYEHVGAAVITKLAAGITSVSTSFTLVNPAGWPTGSTGPWFTVIDAGLATEEKVLCSSRTGDTVQVNGGVAGRGQDGTSAAGHAAGTSGGGDVFPCWTAVEADLVNEHAASSSAVHGASGAVVGTTDAQTLTNKTLTAPTIGDLSNATHDHSNAAGGGGTLNPSSLSRNSIAVVDTLLARKGGNQTRQSTTTLTADTDLIIDIPETGEWVVELLVIWDSTTTADFKFDMNFTGTPGGNNFHTMGHHDAGSTVFSRTDGFNSAVTLQGAGSSTERAFTIKGSFSCTTTGQLQFRWAQGTSEASNTIVEGDSWIRASRPTV